MRLLSCLAVLLTGLFFAQTVAAGPLYSGTKAGCLDVNMGAPIAKGGPNPEYNVILWPNCHGGPNQDWVLTENNQLQVTLNGVPYCLTVDQATNAGANGLAANLYVTARCQRYTFQQLEQVNGGFRMTGYINLGGEFPEICVDVNMSDARGSGGAGRNVIVWPRCHYGPNQQWSWSPF